MNTMELSAVAEPTIYCNDVVLLPYGLLGFERVKNYNLVSDFDESPFQWLQMLEEPRRAFLVLCPDEALPNYHPSFEMEDVEFLGLEDRSDALFLNIATRLDSRQATVNLKSPIVINRRTWIGKQIIPANAGQYSTHHPLSIL